jgi:hypothetical protein
MVGSALLAPQALAVIPALPALRSGARYRAHIPALVIHLIYYLVVSSEAPGLYFGIY